MGSSRTSMLRRVQSFPSCSSDSDDLTEQENIDTNDIESPPVRRPSQNRQIASADLEAAADDANDSGISVTGIWCELPERSQPHAGRHEPSEHQVQTHMGSVAGPD